MTPERKKHAKNGIWLCRNHHKEIDADEKAFPAKLLHKWKKAAEQNRQIPSDGREAMAREPADEEARTRKRLALENEARAEDRKRIREEQERAERVQRTVCTRRSRCVGQHQAPTPGPAWWYDADGVCRECQLPGVLLKWPETMPRVGEDVSEYRIRIERLKQAHNTVLMEHVIEPLMRIIADERAKTKKSEE
jgi:hypothetical protein